jgi:hypothetical protein
VSVDEEGPAAVGVAPGAAERRRLRNDLATGVFWIAGSAIVAVAQPSGDRRLAAVGAAVAGLVVILAVARLTEDSRRRYFRSVVWTIVAVSVSSDWLLRRLGVAGSHFVTAGLVERIALPLLFVLLGPLVLSALRRHGLWGQRATLLRSAHPMDWVFGAYTTVVALPALVVGLAHHDRLLFVAQDLGLIVFFVFMYTAGRAVDADTGRTSATEFVEVLLALAVAQFLLFKWEVAPLFVYIEAACAGAIAVALLRPRTARVLPVALAVTLLAFDAVRIKNGGSSTTAIELGGALALLAYVVARRLQAVPQWLVVALAAVALAGFVGFTSDGATLRGEYYGSDPSNRGRTYEAHQVRTAVRQSSTSLVFGRGLGSTIDETHAPSAFKSSLISGGRDPAHVQEIHLLIYSFLLKTGFLGLFWLAAFAVGLAAVGVRALERAAQERDPSLVVYAALPLIGFVQALAATSRLPANPLNALALGILVTCLGAAGWRATGETS